MIFSGLSRSVREVAERPLTRSVALLLLALGVGMWIIQSSVPPDTFFLKEDGFHPRARTIHEGTTITFVNKTNKYFWPASDLHPTHALYAPFDAQEPIAPGGSYQFTFTKPGTYPFHDHLAAYYLGIIQVADSAGNVIDACDTGDKVMCWQTTLFTVLAEEGLDAALVKVAELFASDPEFSRFCHGATHSIGLASYQLYLEDKNSVYSPKAVACASGFYHGFMEGMIGASGDIETAAQICDTVGKRLVTESPDARFQCFHGIGHGSLETAIASTGVFSSIDDLIEDATTLCEAASKGEHERYRCMSGAYNALANFYIVGAYGLSATKDDPLLLCARQPEIYKESCYGNMNAVVLHQADYDFARASKDILSIKDESHIASAMEYLSGLATVRHLEGRRLVDMIQSCAPLPTVYEASCLTGFAKGLLEHGAPGTEYELALTFCAEPSFPAWARNTCYQKTLGELSWWYSKEKAQDICRSVAPELQPYCSDSMEP